MAYQATILNVMIASPSDVAEERQLVRDAIYEWNAIHSKQFGVMLNPIGWETHVAPEMGSRPQEIINKSILNDSDILIGLFWTRLGSPTGEYVSGTVEEISKHCENNKLASLYISRKPYPDNIDLQQLQLLRDQTQIWLKDGLLEFYDDQSIFKQKIKDHLSLQIQNNKYLKDVIKLNEIKVTNNHLFSEEAKTLLLNAIQGNGIISYSRYIDGTADFDANNFNYRTNNTRAIAKWKAAIKYLLEENIIIELSNDKGIHQICEVTNFGWNLSESLFTSKLNSIDNL
ncbi:DUF4062 domain-containing protein [Acinetobacter sp. ANC 4173]|uniref:DUF4062 domain-containing protein n=1 Tax=Acinetobacter sp. ANC 4173 TaxID=2529837 RepID=UPI00103B3D09|nr:DUF4062 domain-containing protein [Acinetobacter sp. ANC 4173]TCB81803.1 DUF4062 domain-containing protein [Acinetobacter sp. ANC 4173]